MIVPRLEEAITVEIRYPIPNLRTKIDSRVYLENNFCSNRLKTPEFSLSVYG